MLLVSDIWFVNEPNRSFEPVLFIKPVEPVRQIELSRLGQFVSVPNTVNNPIRERVLHSDLKPAEIQE